MLFFNEICELQKTQLKSPKSLIFRVVGNAPRKSKDRSRADVAGGIHSADCLAVYRTSQCSESCVFVGKLEKIFQENAVEVCRHRSKDTKDGCKSAQLP